MGHTQEWIIQGKVEVKTYAHVLFIACKWGTMPNSFCMVLENCCMDLRFRGCVIYTLITASQTQAAPLCIVSLGNAPFPYICTTQLQA